MSQGAILFLAADGDAHQANGCGNYRHDEQCNGR
jgi:hypothetical protein